MSEIKLERRKVPGFEGLYELREDGAVFSLPREIVMSNAVRRYVRGKQLKAVGGKNRHGNKIDSLNKVSLCRGREKPAIVAINALMQAVYPDKFPPIENIEGEVWRKIEGFDEYMVSNLSRVKRLKARRNAGGIEYIRQEYLVPPHLSETNRKFNKSINFMINLRRDSNQENRTLSRIVANAFISPVDDNSEVCFIDGDSGNVDISNLKVVSKLESRANVVIRRFEKKLGLEKIVTNEDGSQSQCCFECKKYFPMTAQYWTMRNGKPVSKCKPCRSQAESDREKAKNRKLKELGRLA